MIRTGLLLAAGASRRFGPQDKLLAPLGGRPLVTHAACALRGTPLDHRIAVIANPALVPLLDGFRIVLIPVGGQQSDSLRAGLGEAGQPDRLLIALGDMPDVTAAHLTRILTAATDDLPSCSHDGTASLPPACFPQARLAALQTLTGDQGAARLLRDLPAAQHIDAPRLLRDIDTPGQIAPT
ncbi:nucleotidyltransferase family protein [Paracoccus liaowanqingii]|uniref:Nucleotidyltransferase family protein n=1 Tax=Paracoccus liaowanqingii TaxID=2560053 RepID=A0A4P7HJV1_9RHOB|nr:NTP transferase domain-containing protein [Paracoccus liaowanqingii]QBX34375.1 nucleotidyltransferase family protein [Paracoccus liaowanqingii]